MLQSKTIILIKGEKTIMKIKANCDKACARVWFGNSYCCFSNGVGDGPFYIHIVKEHKTPNDAEFIADFYSDGTAELDIYDCGAQKDIACLIRKGRYGVSNYNGDVYFEYWDNDK